MAWNLTAQLVEACSCNVICPCLLLTQEYMKMDKGYCDGAFTVRVQEGRAAGVDLSGRTVVLSWALPGPTLFDGNGTACVYVDNGASDAQQKALEAIFQGQRGGPMGLLANFMSTWLPTQSVAIQVQERDGTVTVELGDHGRITSSILKNEAGDPVTVNNAGFGMAIGADQATLGVASTRGSRMSIPGLPRPIETEHGTRQKVRWQGE